MHTSRDGGTRRRCRQARRRQAAKSMDSYGRATKFRVYHRVTPAARRLLPRIEVPARPQHERVRRCQIRAAWSC